MPSSCTETLQGRACAYLSERKLTVYHPVDSLNDTDYHNGGSKHYNAVRHVRPPTPRCELDVAHGRHHIRHGHRAGGSHQLEYSTEIAGQEADEGGTADEPRAEEDVAAHAERTIGVKVRLHHLSADKGLQGQRRQHVEAEAQPRHVDHGVVCGEVVQDVAQCLVAKHEEAGKGHYEARQRRDTD